MLRQMFVTDFTTFFVIDNAVLPWIWFYSGLYTIIS